MKKLVLAMLMVLMLAVPCMAQNTTTTTTPADNRSIEEKLKDGCEITAYIKGEKGNCEMKIKIRDFTGLSHNPKKMEKAILVDTPEECFCKNAPSSASEDWTHSVYYKFMKEKRARGKCPYPYDLWSYSSYSRRIRRFICPENFTDEMRKKNEQYPGSYKVSNEQFHGCFKVSYEEFFREIDKLAYHDNIKLGGETIFVKEREFKELKSGTFNPTPNGTFNPTRTSHPC